MDREQIVTKLLMLYRQEYDAYYQLEMLAKEAIQEGDTAAFEAIHRRAINKSHFLDGLIAATEVLGIDYAEFMDAANQNRLKDDGGEG